MWTNDSGRAVGRKLTCAREDCDGYNNTKSTGSRRRRLRDRTVHRTLLRPPLAVAPRDHYRIRGRRRRRRWLHVGDFFFHFLFLNAERVTSIGIPRFVIAVNTYGRVRRAYAVGIKVGTKFQHRFPRIPECPPNKMFRFYELHSSVWFFDFDRIPTRIKRQNKTNRQSHRYRLGKIK